MKTQTKAAQSVKLTPEQKKWTLSLMAGKTIGEKIKLARIAAGLSLAALAEAVGMKRQNLHRLEKSPRSPSVEKITKLAKALGFNASDLITK